MLLQDNKLLFLCTAIVSFGLTFWAISVDPVVNPDALLYLSAADELKQGNIGNAFELYKWPFYSFVIAHCELQIVLTNNTNRIPDTR